MKRRKSPLDIHKVNPSTPRPEGQGLLRVDPERRFFTLSSKAGLSAAEWVNHGRHVDSQRMDDIIFFKIEELKEHEEIRPDYLEELKNEILSDGILKMPIAVDKKTYIILDGHHRLHALKKIGCQRIPVILFDYQSPEIKVLPHREGEIVTKEMIIQTALAGRKMPPKTSKHMIMIEGELKHISILETVINIPLERLK